MEKLNIEFNADGRTNTEDCTPEYATIGLLKVRVGDTLLTELTQLWDSEPGWGPGPYVSAYCLSIWFASNWWRLRCEGCPEYVDDADIDWWMSHGMVAAGYGYVWPNIIIWRDGDVLMVKSGSTIDPGYIRYLGANNDQPVPVSIESFDQTIDNLFDSTLTMLRNANLTDTDLHALLVDLHEERNDPELRVVREQESIAGQDPPYEMISTK